MTLTPKEIEAAKRAIDSMKLRQVKTETAPPQEVTPPPRYIHYLRAHNLYRATLPVNGKVVTIGRHRTVKLAVKAQKDYCKKNGLDFDDIMVKRYRGKVCGQAKE